jgi:hypothetical protein
MCAVFCKTAPRKIADTPLVLARVEELLYATLFSTAGQGACRRPNRDCGQRAAAEAAARHNATKPHRLLTYRDAGSERASGAAGQSKGQAGASTSRRHQSWTPKESRASSGLEKWYDIGTDHAGV